MDRDDSLVQGPVLGSLVRFAIPVLLANILTVVYGAADMWVVGTFATTADVSGVSVSSQIMSTLNLIISGMTTGASVLLGQYCGAGNEKGLRHVAGTAIAFFAIVAVAVTIPLLACNRLIIHAMQTPAEAVGPARDYLLICSIGFVFILGYHLVSSFMRGMGDSKSPLIFVAVSAVINIVADLILVKGFSMGAAGAAIATVGAQAISMILSIVYLKKKGLGFPFSRKDVRLRKSVLGPMVRIGLPLSLQELLVNLSFIFITYVVNGIGLNESAAVGIVEKVMSFLAMPTLAICMSVSTMTAHNIGAHRFDRARKSLWYGILVSICIALAANIFTFFMGDRLVGLFQSDPEVMRAGGLYIKTYGLDCIMFAIVFNFNGFFSGSNHTTFSMIHSVAVTLLIRIPAVYLFSRMAGATLTHIGLAAPLSTLGSVIMCLCYYLWLRRHGDEEKMIAAK